ncbi:hypothetical protein DJ568_05670 [Mucilaginibacter hurinus]|uniref:Uncharacterized protein n=1 Tax=Mucilaginibacter hurinus TaxID=2201324 RepID=A0A367GTT5_9SPHI|nr:hypothetical protein [Mucilaginibacter hurinus]RCH56221.1 hypothetical protein DJ568_05670 [Mucilaginibacter hurinus]
MKKTFIAVLSALLFILTSSSTISRSFTADKESGINMLLIAKLSAKYPLTYLSNNPPRVYTTFKKNNFSAHYALAYLFTPHPTNAGQYEGNVYFVYGVDENDFVPVTAPTGGVNLSGSIRFGTDPQNYPFSVTIPQGSNSLEHEPLPFYGFPYLSSLTVSPSTYLGHGIYTYNAN